MSFSDVEGRASARLVRGPLVILGVGLGGVVDGIVFRQILRWHRVLSGDIGAELPYYDLQIHVLADGMFRAVTGAAVVVGLALTARRIRAGDRIPGRKASFGLVIMGWGVFNIVEGLVSHHLLGTHRVRADAAEPWIYDTAFLASGALLIVAGWALARGATAAKPTDARRDPRSPRGRTTRRPLK